LPRFRTQLRNAESFFPTLLHKALCSLRPALYG
jgi:hypothetical protein